MPLETLVVPPASRAGASAAPILPARVVKRDGKHAVFELAKIASAIARAGAATGEFDAAEAGRLADAVGRVLAHRFAAGAPDIERVQDTVEHTLAAAGHFDTARAYIVYREQRTRGCATTARRWSTSPRSVNEYLEQKPTGA